MVLREDTVEQLINGVSWQWDPISKHLRYDWLTASSSLQVSSHETSGRMEEEKRLGQIYSEASKWYACEHLTKTDVHRQTSKETLRTPLKSLLSRL